MTKKDVRVERGAQTRNHSGRRGAPAGATRSCCSRTRSSTWNPKGIWSRPGSRRRGPVNDQGNRTSQATRSSSGPASSTSTCWIRTGTRPASATWATPSALPSRWKPSAPPCSPATGPRPRSSRTRCGSIAHTITTEVHDMSIDNIALFIAGEVERQAQAATAVTDEKDHGRPGTLVSARRDHRPAHRLRPRSLP